MAQGFLDLLLDLQQGSIQRSCLGSDFWKVGNMGGAAVCREYAEYRIRLVLYGDAVLHTLKSESLLIHPKILTRKSESVLIHFGGPRAYFAQFVCFAFVIYSHPFLIFSVALCNPFEYTFRGEKKEPGEPYRFGKALRALSIFSLFYPGVRVHFPRKS